MMADCNSRKSMSSVSLISHLKMELKTDKFSEQKKWREITRGNISKIFTLAPVRTIFPETNISKTILGCFIR